MNSYRRRDSGVSALAVLVVICALLVFAVRGCVTGCGADYSNGERTGTVTKFSKKGVWLKSWEGELIMNGILQGSQGAFVANVFQFSVREEDTTTIKAIQKALESGQRVSLVYRQWLGHPLSIDTDYEIKEVK